MLVWGLLFTSVWFSLLVSGPQEGHQKLKVHKTLRRHLSRAKHQEMYQRVRAGSMLKERKCVQVGRMQRQHIHFLSLPEHMTHKLASLKKKWKCIHCTGGQRSTVKMWTGPYPLLKLRGRTSSSSGFGETSSACRVTTSLQPMSSIALRSTLNVSPHC